MIKEAAKMPDLPTERVGEILAEMALPENEVKQVVHETAKACSVIEKLIHNGIAVHKAEFIHAINNADNVPENMLSEKSANASRRAEMWLTTAGLICFQKGVYFGTPAANVKYVHFK